MRMTARCLHHLFGGVRFSKVSGLHHDFVAVAAQFGRDLFEQIGVPAGEKQISALRSQCPCARRAQTPGGTRDQRDVAV